MGGCPRPCHRLNREFALPSRAAALEGDLLDVPLRARALDQDIVRDRVQLVNDAASLALAHAGLNPAEQLASAFIEAVDLPGAVAAVHVTLGDLNAPRCPDARIACLESHRRAVVNLDAVVTAVGDVHQLAVRGNAVRCAELIGAVPVGPDGLHPRAV